MIRICAVEYLNTKPFLAGLEAHFSPSELSVRLLPPAQCAQAFARAEADVALVPVGSLLDFGAVHILPGHCIGASGQVDSVFLLAQQSVRSLRAVLLDPHSRSSNGLARILMADYWQHAVDWQRPTDSAQYFEAAMDDVGAVLIGDRAVIHRQRFAYQYDLAQEWQAHTGLPFAFAVWVYRPEALNLAQQNRLQEAFAAGLTDLPAVAQRWAAPFGLAPPAALHYFQTAIHYDLDPPKQQAIYRYLQRLAALDRLPMPQLLGMAPQQQAVG
jgi:chorismate dehydratase